MAEPQIDPTFIGGQPPSQVPPTEQVADDQPRSVEENSFVINAPAVQHAGESDIKKMIMDAFFEARKRKLPSGQADVGLYEKNIDVLLSRGEVVVPPEIAKKKPTLNSSSSRWAFLFFCFLILSVNHDAYTQKNQDRNP